MTGTVAKRADGAETLATALELWDRTGRLGIGLDGETGLPQVLLARLTGTDVTSLPLSWQAVLLTDGIEIERHPYGLAYDQTIRRDAFRLTNDEIRHELLGIEEIFTVVTQVDGWRVEWRYRFRQRAPRLEVTWVIAPPPDVESGMLRNLTVALRFCPDSLAGWLLEAPGAPVRPGLAAATLAQPVVASDPSDRGSGMVVLHQPEAQRALLVWPFSRTERSRTTIRREGETIELAIETGLAGRIPPTDCLGYGAIELDAFASGWPELRSLAQTWYEPLGLAVPGDTADWIRGASIFEVQIGTSVFWRGFQYSPYPTMRDLYDDLGRIAGLGFDCIQIMPRQPFPSYNVFDYTDVTTSYGDEEDLKRVVAACHALGMRVILDILMHGVIDADIIHRAADRVRNGPYFAHLDEGVARDGEEPRDYEVGDYLVAWSRHILDFEEHWASGSPGEHPLVAEHPDWFMRNSAGEIIGVYTKAFDVANVEWQAYFTNAALDLVRRLDVDGFRFDAPTYNDANNWSAATARRASYSQLGSVEHFAALRPQLKALKPEAMLYTEPSGALFRQTMDITYNYDEHWLIHAMLRPEQTGDAATVGIRHARDLAHWMRDKEAALPAGAMTARHIDSHDTFWWPLPGRKWRREQYGLAATRALIATWSLIGGVYMTFVGGEQQLEDELRRANRLRHELPEIRLGAANYDAVRADDDRIFAVARIHQGLLSLVLVNLSAQAMESAIEIGPDVTSIAPEFTVRDMWVDVALAGADGYRWKLARLTHLSVTFAPFQPRVLTIRPVSAVATGVGPR